MELVVVVVVLVVVVVVVVGGEGSVGCFLLCVQSVKQVRVLKWATPPTPPKKKKKKRQQQQQYTKTIARKCI